jgi:hypothetical protein
MRIEAGDINLQNFRGDTKTQALALYKLICAMYSLPFVLNAPDELLLVTAMARFYAALPVLSRYLSNIFPRSLSFLDTMHNKPIELLVATKELTHPKLFKDCLLLCFGPWESPIFLQLQDPQLKRAATHARNGICHEISRTQERIIHAIGDDKSRNNLSTALGSAEVSAAKQVSSSHASNGSTYLPCYYRNLLDSTAALLPQVRYYIKPLLQNQLRLANATNMDNHECYLFGLTILDEDLPWDQKQTDW